MRFIEKRVVLLPGMLVVLKIHNTPPLLLYAMYANIVPSLKILIVVFLIFSQTQLASDHHGHGAVD